MWSQIIIGLVHGLMMNMQQEIYSNADQLRLMLIGGH